MSTLKLTGANEVKFDSHFSLCSIECYFFGLFHFNPYMLCH